MSSHRIVPRKVQESDSIFQRKLDSLENSRLQQKLDSFDNLIEDEVKLFKTKYLKFTNKKIQKDFIFDDFQKKIKIALFGSIVDLCYFIATLIIVRTTESFQFHMGGQHIISCIIVLVVVEFITIAISIYLYQYKKTTLEKYFALMHAIAFYPTILLRSIGYVLAQNMLAFDPVTSYTTVFEQMSFWCYMFIGKGIYSVVASLDFRSGLGTIALASISFIVANISGSRNSMAKIGNIMSCVTGIGFGIAFCFFCSKTMKSYTLEILHQRALIRERVRLRAHHQQEVEHLSTVVKEKSLVFGQLAHDIGTPLAALSMSIEILEEAALNRDSKYALGAVALAEKIEQREAFDAIHASVATIKVLRQSMLDYVKKTNGVLLKPSFENVDVPKLIKKRIFLLLRQLLGKKSKVQAKCYVDPRLESRKMLSAENWLIDMLLNYVSNAVKFTKEGQIEISASLIVKDGDPDMVKFEVRDTGCGIPADKYGALFQAFAQLQDDKGGTGLGLCAVKQKAVALGGDAGFFNNNGPGSTFYFTIPADQEVMESLRRCSYRESVGRRSIQSPHSSTLSRRSSQANRGGRSSLQRMAVQKKDQREKSNEVSNPLASTRRFSFQPIDALKGLYMHSRTNSSRGTNYSAQTSSRISLEKSLNGTIRSIPEKHSVRSIRNIPGQLSNANNEEIEVSGPSSVFWPGEVKQSHPSDMAEVIPQKKGRLFLMSEEEEKDIMPITAMVVDDSPVLLNLYSRMMKKAGATRVLKAENGDECLDQLFGNQGVKVDIIIMDDQMPGLRGPEVAKEVVLRSQAMGWLCPRIFICTGAAKEMLEDDFPDIYEYVQEILLKPVPLEYFKALIAATTQNNFVSPIASSFSNPALSFKPSLAPPSSKPFELDLSALMTAQIENLESSRLDTLTNRPKRRRVPKLDIEMCSKEGKSISPKVSPWDNLKGVVRNLASTPVTNNNRSFFPVINHPDVNNDTDVVLEHLESTI